MFVIEIRIEIRISFEYQEKIWIELGAILAAGLEFIYHRSEDLLVSFLDLLRPSSDFFRSGFSAYMAYHIRLSRNTLIFSSIRCSTRVLTERARAHLDDFHTVTLPSTEILGSDFAPRAPGGFLFPGSPLL